MSIGLRRISTRTISLIFITILCLVPCVDTASAQFMVQANKVRVVKGSVYLDVAVWNCSRHRVVKQLADLPWGENAIGIVVYAAGPRGGQPLMEAGPIADFPIKDVAISPRSFASGAINLSRLFPDLVRYTKYNDLVLFWVYDMSLIQGGAHAYVGGMLPFIQSSAGSKKGLFDDPCD